MGAKDLMRQSHMTGQIPHKKKEVVNDKKNKKVISDPSEHSMHVDAQAHTNESIPTAIKQVKRPDIPIDTYGVKPDITNFQLYDYDLSSFLTTFSKQNKKNGGNPITKSQLMEIILGFVYYDMDLKPDGFKNTQELLAYLQDKLKN